jgi:hypothetical protein
MGYLLQSSSGIANSPYLTLSSWFRIPTVSFAAGFCSLFEAWQSGQQLFTITLTGSGVPQITGIRVQAVSDPNYDNFCQWELTTIDRSFTIAFDSWHHIAVAVDTNRTSVGDGAGNKATLGTPELDNKRAIVVLDGVNWSIPIPPSINATAPSMNEGDSLTTNQFPYGAFNIGFNGSSIGMPFVNSYPTTSPSSSYWLSSGPKIEFGDVQIWNSFIDPRISGNFSKLVTISGGKGTPADPAIAELTFGRPTLRFTGNHTKFPTNTGTGGAFSLVGTDIDFTPTPSYG